MRQIAMNWWNNLKESEKEQLYKEYERKGFTPANSWRTLTGREIERIYKSKQ